MTNAARKEEVNHAEQNAAAWYGTICEQVAALECDYDRLEELTDQLEGLTSEADAKTAGLEEEWAELQELTAAATLEGEIQKDADTVRERIQEGPLSVEVRSDWHAPGDEGEASKPAGFCILLSTGGPALRIMGDLDEHGQPSRAYLQYQDWGTPWTDYFHSSGSGDVLLTYCQQFYFGE